MPIRRNHDHYRAIARALEVVGDRWTLLVVRELLIGPKRHTDLRARLPGIATNVLGDRLQLLQQAGLVRRAIIPRRPPPPRTSSPTAAAGASRCCWPWRAGGCRCWAARATRTPTGSAGWSWPWSSASTRTLPVESS